MKDYDFEDVKARTRAEVALLLKQYSIRLADRALDIAESDYRRNGLNGRTAEEVGRAAFAQAGQETGLLTDSRPALANPTS